MLELLKQQVTVASLRDFDPTRQAILDSDAFDYVTGGMISQHNDEKVLHPIVFYGHSMISAECRSSYL